MKLPRKAILPGIVGTLWIIVLSSNHFARDPFKDGFGYVLLVVLVIAFARQLRKHVLSRCRQGQQPGWAPLLPFLTIFAVAAAIVAFTQYKRGKKVWLQADARVGVSRTVLSLNTDSTWIAAESSALGDHFEYGEYRLDGDRVHLKNAGGVHHLTGSTLLIVADPDGGPRELVQLDQAQQVDLTAEQFSVIAN